MKLLVCGGRNNTDAVNTVMQLNKLLNFYGKITIITGGCKTGIDNIVRKWCFNKGIPYFECPAQWEHYGDCAGPVRNKWMLDQFKPDCVIAFSGGSGTKHTIAIANKAGIPVYEL